MVNNKLLMAIIAVILFGSAAASCATETTTENSESERVVPIHSPDDTVIENMSSPTTPDASPQSDNNFIDKIHLDVSQKTYQNGKEIHFTINNNSERPIYYTYGGCSWPIVFKLGSEEISIAINTDLTVPNVVELKPGEKDTCIWDQTAWQDPNEQSNVRFQSYDTLTFVPAGQYQFQLDYFFDESQVYSRELAQTTRSQIFNIE